MVYGESVVFHAEEGIAYDRYFRRTCEFFDQIGAEQFFEFSDGKEGFSLRNYMIPGKEETIFAHLFADEREGLIEVAYDSETDAAQLLKASLECKVKTGNSLKL